jgi:hypothetical protein
VRNAKKRSSGESGRRSGKIAMMISTAIGRKMETGSEETRGLMWAVR